MLRTRRTPRTGRTLLMPPTLRNHPKQMPAEIASQDSTNDGAELVVISHDLVSVEALLKTCYWFSRNFVCDVTQDSLGQSTVHLKPKPSCRVDIGEARESFMAQAMDFALRERV